jgi:hypothetical protein
MNNLLFCLLISVSGVVLPIDFLIDLGEFMIVWINVE